METLGIKFKRALLASFIMITEAVKGKKIELEVLRNVTEKNLVESENGRKSYIVNFKAITPDKVAAVRELFAEREEVDIEETNGLFLTANIWANEGQPTPYLPMKGEKMNVIIGEVPNREGEAVLRVLNHSAQPAAKVQTNALAALFAPATAQAAETTVE